MAPSDATAHDALPRMALDWLATLPPHLHLGGVFCCHGTPASDDSYLCERITPDGAVALRDAPAIAADLAGVDAGLILCAHSHLPRARHLPDGRQVVNPGSVGCPAYRDDTPLPHVVQSGFPEAAYALLDSGPGGWTVTFRRVAYDIRRMVALATPRGRPDWAQAVATGWITP